MKVTLGVLTLALVVAAHPAAAQDLPRLSDGRPDLNGIWQVLNEANYDPRAAHGSSFPALREGPVGRCRPFPRCGWARSARCRGASGSSSVAARSRTRRRRAPLKGENAANWTERDPEVRCNMPGVPRATYIPMPSRSSTARRTSSSPTSSPVRSVDIYMDNPGPSQVDSWMGWSVGNWEGDTLVVDVTGIATGAGWTGPAAITATRCTW